MYSTLYSVINIAKIIKSSVASLQELDTDPLSTSEVLFVKNLLIQVLGLTLDFLGRIEHFLLMNTVNPVPFNPRNPGLNLDPGSKNSSRIAPLDIIDSVVATANLISQCATNTSWFLVLSYIQYVPTKIELFINVLFPLQRYTVRSKSH
jgi:hypothetical protein